MYDVCIIGAGPGGYVAAIKAARLGAKVALIEKELLGGTCLNKGCIPTKVFAHSAEILSEIRSAQKFGINTGGLSFDLKTLIAQKNEIVKKLRTGIDYLIKTRKIDLVAGQAQILNKNSVKVNESIIETKNIIIATGSRPVELPGLLFDKKDILSSDDLLELNSVPETLLIIGAGVIGCEFASIFSEFGAKVTLVEMAPQILPLMDPEVSKKLEVIFKKKAIQVHLNTKISKIIKKDGVLEACADNNKTIEAKKILVCVGRRADCEGLNLEKLGVKTQGGKILVDSHLKTNIDNVYAIGDVVGKYWLAHVASYEGVIAARNIMGEKCSADYSAVPNCIFTIPEIATVGLTEDEAKKQGIEVKTGKFPFQALGKAHAAGQTEGFVKIVSDAKSKKILGAQIIGPHATDLISEITLAISTKATTEDLEKTIHAHPSFPEAVSEACESIFHGAIHLP